jgi:unspecific monooxygenase
MRGSSTGSAPRALPQRLFDLLDPAFIRDPYPLLARIREEEPVFYDPRWDKVFFSRYDDIATILRSRSFGRTMLHLRSREELGWPPPDLRQAAFDRFESNHLLSNEPPVHTRLRTLVAKAFTAKRVEDLRERVTAIVDDALAGLAARRSFDLVRDFAEPLPVIVISELLGVAARFRPQLRAWSAAIVKMYELHHSEAEQQAANDAVVNFSAMLRELVTARRREPRDDLITALAQVEEAGDRISEDELIGTCILLLNAGHEATVNGTSGAVLALMRRREAWETLAAAAQADGPTAPLFKTAVDELLRYDSPLPLFERWVLEDTSVHGTVLAAGTKIALLYASGNRDPRKFTQPDEIDLAREPNAHLTFGLGTHFCLGAPLARMEMQLALHGLARHLPGLRLSHDGAWPEYNAGFVIRGLARLPMTLGA